MGVLSAGVDFALTMDFVLDWEHWTSAPPWKPFLSSMSALVHPPCHLAIGRWARLLPSPSIFRHIRRDTNNLTMIRSTATVLEIYGLSSGCTLITGCGLGLAVTVVFRSTVCKQLTFVLLWVLIVVRGVVWIFRLFIFLFLCLWNVYVGVVWVLVQTLV